MNEPPAILTPPRPAARLHLRVMLGPAAAMGPGRADFLAAVDAVGSIVGAGRALGLSYMKVRHPLDALKFCKRKRSLNFHQRKSSTTHKNFCL